MFTLGLEFSLDELKHLRKTALLGGGLQMFLCTAVFGLGLLGEEPQTVVPRDIPGMIARLHQQETLSVTEDKTVRFSPSRDLDPVSYTHLDVYKRQLHRSVLRVPGQP